MRIASLFRKPITRPINGVVKADQLDPSSIWQELDEFVVTRELDRHLRSFFSAYCNAMDHSNDPTVTDKMGVWVSGFFGSGKSHFIKVLSYLLANQEHTYDGQTKRAVAFFESKIADPMLLGDIKRAMASHTEVMLFNIDSKADTSRYGRDAILAVFLKVLNEMQGSPARGEGALLEENLTFIADSLGPNRGEQPRDTIRRYLATGFYKHHLSLYKRRPIYWLFCSGKQRAFQCLVYLHQYNESTLSRLRTAYVIPLQGKLDARIDHLGGDIAAASSTSHRRRLEKERDKLLKQREELLAFDEQLRHYADQRIRLDLDDGVKVNYGKFGSLPAEVKAVTGKEPA